MHRHSHTVCVVGIVVRVHCLCSLFSVVYSSFIPFPIDIFYPISHVCECTIHSFETISIRAILHGDALAYANDICINSKKDGKQKDAARKTFMTTTAMLEPNEQYEL